MHIDAHTPQNELAAIAVAKPRSVSVETPRSAMKGLACLK
jgi:hypothetical protein